MNIAYISLENPYSSNNNGGIGTYTGMVAQMMAKNKHNVHVFTIGNKCSMQIIDENIVLHTVSSLHTQHFFFLEQALKLFDELALVHKKVDFNIIESQEWLAPGVIIAQELNIPFVTRLHTPLFLVQELTNNCKFYKLNDFIKSYEWMQADKSKILSSPSLALSRIVYREWGIPSKVLCNPIIVNDHLPICNPITKLYLLYIGRLEYRKGILQYAKVLANVFKYVPNFQMVFCGTDTFYNKKSVKKQILEICHGYEERICFISHVNGEMKDKLIENARALVVPSVWENFPYVVLEGMAKGKTIIASRSGGISEIIEDGISGTLVEFDDIYMWQQRIIQVLRGDIDTGWNAYERVRNCYSLDILYPQFLELYESLLEDKR